MLLFCFRRVAWLMNKYVFLAATSCSSRFTKYEINREEEQSLTPPLIYRFPWLPLQLRECPPSSTVDVEVGQAA